MREGDAREGAAGADLRPEDARNLMCAWLEAVELEAGGQDLVALMQEEDFSHSALYRRAQRLHERKLRRAVDEALTAAHRRAGYDRALEALFEACIAAVPYAPATAFLGKEKAKLINRDGEPRRVALVADAVGGMHGVTHTLEEIRERTVPGYEVEVIGTDHNVDRRLSAVREVDIPFYAGLRVGVPSIPAIVEVLGEGRYDVVHLCSPGPAGIGAAITARIMEVPVVGSYHTELAAYAGLRTEDPLLEAAMNKALSLFYGHCQVVLSPSESSDRSLRELGIAADRIGRWDRGVDVSRFSPANRVEGLFPGEVNVLYAGRQTKEKGADLLAEAFLRAHRSDPRLHLVLAGGGPEEERLREQLGERATFLGWLEGDELARAYASADIFLFASRTDTFGQVIPEAQASGLPVVAVAEGGPAGLIEDGDSGILRPPSAEELSQALLRLALDERLRAKLREGGLTAVSARTWERSLTALAAGYDRALGVAAPAAARVAA
jgi:glycosyltransferase involved in cell wall biosynthesis